MTTNVFINLPVKNLDQSITFFSALGYQFNPQFTDAHATCMIVSETIYVMLLDHARFSDFAPNPICDATKQTEVLICLSCDSKQAVDAMIEKALFAGATTHKEPQDHGFMYAHSYQDLDGHVWELVWMDPNHIQ